MMYETGKALAAGILSVSLLTSPDPNLLTSETVVRVLDGNTVKLQPSGILRLEGLAVPNTGRLPACFKYEPAAHLQQLLPAGTKIYAERRGTSPTTAYLYRRSDDLDINLRLVKGGWAKVTKASVDFDDAPHRAKLLKGQQEARDLGRGLWAICTEQPTLPNLEEIRTTSKAFTSIPNNPGDIKNCGDFEYYEDAKRFYDRYYTFYGDVAKLDRDGNGIPCEKLAHTPNVLLKQLKQPKIGSR